MTRIQSSECFRAAVARRSAGNGHRSLEAMDSRTGDSYFLTNALLSERDATRGRALFQLPGQRPATCRQLRFSNFGTPPTALGTSLRYPGFPCRVLETIGPARLLDDWSTPISPLAGTGRRRQTDGRSPSSPRGWDISLSLPHRCGAQHGMPRPSRFAPTKTARSRRLGRIRQPPEAFRKAVVTFRSIHLASIITLHSPWRPASIIVWLGSRSVLRMASASSRAPSLPHRPSRPLCTPPRPHWHSA